MNKKTLLHIFLLIFSLFLLVSCGRKQTKEEESQRLSVPVANPIELELTEYTEYTGRLEAVEIVDVKPRVSGYIESIHFKEGQKVRKGDLLFEIDPRPFQAQVNRLKAQVAQTEAALKLANANKNRAERLIESRAISLEEIDIRESEAYQAQADLEAAQAELEAAELDLSFTQVTAPINGIADRHFVTLGNLVTGDLTSLTTIMPHAPIHAYYEVDERSFLRGVRAYFEGDQPGRGSGVKIPAYLGLDDEEDFPHEGVIDFASNQIDPNTATITIRALFENKNEFLTPGLFARIRVPVSKKQKRILIPDTSIASDQSIRYVWVVSADNTPERRQIELGPRHKNYRIVRSGLTTEDRIVISGIQYLRPGIVLDPQSTEI